MQLDQKACESYYCQQIGTGNNNNYFQGTAHQRGRGIFSNLIKFITPIALKAGKYLGKHILHTGSKVMTDVATGSSFKDSARSRFRETSKKIKDDIIHKIQRGSGIKRKKFYNKSHSQRIKRSRKKFKETDIFS